MAYFVPVIVCLIVKDQLARLMPAVKNSLLSELLTSSTRGRNGGGKRIRTADPLLAKQVLFQLSYTPSISAPAGGAMVGLGRVELPTSPLSGVRSSQLSYRPSSRTGASSAHDFRSSPRAKAFTAGASQPRP